MKLNFSEIKDALINFLYPDNPICPICKRVLFTDESNICFNCIGSIKIKNHDECVICGNKVKNKVGLCDDCRTKIYEFAYGYSYTDYDYLTREVVLEFKFHFNISVAKYCARLMYEDIRKSGIHMDYDLITCVPSKKESLKDRGYNQAAILASELSYLSGLPVNNDLLMVVGTPKDQIGLNFSQRKENVKNKFALNTNADNIDIENKHILIVDDVITTGATLSECASVLKASGAKLISFITFASASRFYKEREV